MTTPRTVNPERSLFLRSVRKEIISRSKRSTGLPRAEHAFGANHHGLVLGELSVQDLRKMVFHQAERDGHGPQQLLVLDPDQAVPALAGQIRFFVGRALRAVVIHASREGLHVVSIL